MQHLFSSVRALPARLGSVLFVTGMALCLVGAPHAAHAAVASRGDPLVTLSNGITVDLHVQIGDSLSDVQHIFYVLHGPALPAAGPLPAGAFPVGSGWYTASYPDHTDGISTLTYVADGKPHQFYAVITVITGATAVSVVSYLDWTAGGKHNSGTAQVTSTSGQATQTPVLKVVCANQCSG